MMYVSQFKEWITSTGTRLGKVLSLGGALTLKECSPFGMDGNPITNMMAIYSTTPNSKQKYIVGYINKNQLAEEGETRLYSVDSGGNLKSYIWNKNDGVLELNGNQYTAVRFENLKQQIDLLQQQINSQWPLIASGIATGGGTYIPANVNVDITSAQSPDVKLK